MPQWLPLQRGEILPLFTKPRDERSCFSYLGRRWRSLHRLQRSAIICSVLFCIILFYLKQRNFNAQIDVKFDKPLYIVKTDSPYEVNRLKIPIFGEPTNYRQKAIRDAFLHAWNGYKHYSWGHDQLKPISKGYSEWMECGLTIVDSLDTLLIMNLKTEFNEAKNWVAESLTFDKDNFVSLFETTIRVLGGLLSAFHLSGDDIFKSKSVDIGSRLIWALNTPSAVPYSDVNLKTGETKQPGWGGESSLSEITSIQLEFRDLSRLVGNETFEKMAFRVSQHIHNIGCKEHDGLCKMFLSVTTGKFRETSVITFGARADSYYEYLLKQWLQTGKHIDWLRSDYEEAMAGMKKHLWRYSEPSKLGFVGELLGDGIYSPKMDHLVCFLAGTLALGVYHGLPSSHMETAKELSESCFEMYKTATGLAPEIVYFNLLPGLKNDIIIKPLDAHSLLRPEAFEAWFYMFRITNDKKYQEWGWEAFKAIEKYAKVEHGYSSVNSCKKIPVSYRDLMESFFLSETLKYLYLLLCDDQSILPLDQYVFNTEGHPLPIIFDVKK